MEDKNTKWMNIHGILKTMVHTVVGGMVSSAGYVLSYNDISVVKEKSELRSPVLKRLWSCWDLAFERWEKELELPTYKDRKTYQMMVSFRNIAFTIIENDGAYIKLVSHFMRAWEDVKEDDKYLED
jgi:hypothetical protein